MSGTWLVLPTYNEAENIEPIVARRAGRSCRGDRPSTTSWSSTTTRPTARGGSPTGWRRELDEVEVLHRAGKEGLGPRLPRRLRATRWRSGADLVMEMDSDFSHDPADIPRLVHAAADGADLVLGSRYMPGGGVERLGRSGGGWSRAAAACTRR